MKEDILQAFWLPIYTIVFMTVLVCSVGLALKFLQLFFRLLF